MVLGIDTKAGSKGVMGLWNDLGYRNNVLNILYFLKFQQRHTFKRGHG